MQSGALDENSSLGRALSGLPEAPLVNVVVPTGSNALGDTLLEAIKDAITQCETGGVVQVSLKSTWWETRLYLLAALAAKLADDQQLLFRDENDRFLGLASARAVRECLADLHPALREFDRSLDTMELPPNLESRVERVLQAWELMTSQRGGERAIGGSVRRQDVRKWLGDRMQTRHVRLVAQHGSDRGMQRLLEWPNRFVPVEHDNTLFVAPARHAAPAAPAQGSALQTRRSAEGPDRTAPGRWSRRCRW